MLNTCMQNFRGIGSLEYFQNSLTIVKCPKYGQFTSYFILNEEFPIKKIHLNSNKQTKFSSSI